MLLQNLLTKWAKVYEAAESVEGMQPKEVRESHKQCTPGEFGMHVKEAGGFGTFLMNAAKQTATNAAKKSVPVPRVVTNKVVNGATGQLVSGGAKPVPSWLIKNRDAQATAMSKARSSVPGAVPPPTPAPAKMVITPEQAAAATGLPKPPGLITPNPATRKPLGPEGWGHVPGTAQPQQTSGIDPDTLKFLNRYNNRPGDGAATLRARQPGGYNMTPQEIAAQRAMQARERHQQLLSAGQTPNIQNMGLAKPQPGMIKTQSAHAFGATVKEAASLQEMLQALATQGNRANHYVPYGLGGAGVGSVVGGLLSPKGKLLRGMLRGGVVGGGLGLGTAAGQTLVDNFDRVSGEFTPLGRVVVPGAGALIGATAGAMTNRVSDELASESNTDDDKKNKNSGMTKTQSAHAFGEKAALLSPFSNNLQNISPLAAALDFNDPKSKKMLALLPLLGAVSGGAYGAYRAPKGKKLKHGLIGAGVGGGVGVGGSLLGSALAVPGNRLAKQLSGAPQKMQAAEEAQQAAHNEYKRLQDDYSHSAYTRNDPEAAAKWLDDVQKTMADSAQHDKDYWAARAAANSAGSAGYGAGMLGGGGLATLAGLYAAKRYVDKNDKKEKRSAAGVFGEKAAFNIDWNALKHPALGGAALGAGLGGLAGLVSPGEDEEGNPRSRFGAMLRGALGGGAVGGLGGAAMGHFAPGPTSQMQNWLQQQYHTGRDIAGYPKTDRMTPVQKIIHGRASNLLGRDSGQFRREVIDRALAQPAAELEPIQFPQQQ